MKKSYDFSKGTRNPYAKRLNRQVTIRLDEATIACAVSHKRLDLKWRPDRDRAA